MMLLLLCLIGMTSSQSQIRILPDGGYSDIVVRIADSVNQDYCSQYIKHLTVSSTTSPPPSPPPAFLHLICVLPPIRHSQFLPPPPFTHQPNPSLSPLLPLENFVRWPAFMNPRRCKTIFKEDILMLTKTSFSFKRCVTWSSMISPLTSFTFSNLGPVPYQLLVISIISTSLDTFTTTTTKPYLAHLTGRFIHRGIKLISVSDESYPRRRSFIPSPFHPHFTVR